MTITRFLVVACGLAFIYFGIISLASPSVILDFHRFGLERLRVLAGIFEILGGLGLLGGLIYRPALLISSAGLAVMMLIAFAARVRVRDSVALSLPSFLFMLLNIYLFIQTLITPTIDHVGIKSNKAPSPLAAPRQAQHKTTASSPPSSPSDTRT